MAVQAGGVHAVNAVGQVACWRALRVPMRCDGEHPCLARGSSCADAAWAGLSGNGCLTAAVPERGSDSVWVAAWAPLA